MANENQSYGASEDETEAETDNESDNESDEEDKDDSEYSRFDNSKNE